MRHAGPPYGLGALVGDSISALGLEQRVREQTALLIWDDVVGEQVAGAAQPEFARDGILFVTAKSAVWSNELGFYKRDIIERLNRRIGGRVLKDIVFKVGKLRPGHGGRGETDAGPAETGLEGIPLTDAELEQVETAAKAAGDPKLVESVRSLLVSALRLEKWKQAQGWTPCTGCGALQNDPSGLCPLCRM